MDVSIIITSYNYEKYIAECLESCINQNTNRSYEVIVVDDGSTDNTRDIVECFLNENPCLIYHRIDNSGIEKASNYGINKAAGRYIVRVDADDLLEEDFIEKTVSAIENINISFVYPNYQLIDQNSELIEYSDLPEFNIVEILTRGDFLATGTLYTKSDLLAVGLYSEDVRNCGLENYELIIKLLNEQKFGLLINDSLFKYRRHQKNISEIKRSSIIEYGKYLFAKFNIGEFQTNIYHPYNLEL